MDVVVLLSVRYRNLEGVERKWLRTVDSGEGGRRKRLGVGEEDREGLDLSKGE